ncbi:MAG TPA: hypothetical protein GX017_04555 [Clostridiales bacterium]|jgi:RNA polymerase subunit RPABC4/transcription elongation factor Spt4|nr:hypothetical protein [Clostridiales bacterium]
MAFYKQTCIRCNALIDGDSSFCPKCGSKSPFADRCFSCFKEISRDDKICSGCGRNLNITCPHCGQSTFMQDKCEKCKADLMIVCPNRRCGAFQFFDAVKCSACGKKLPQKR